MKMMAILGFFLVTFLWGSFYSVTKEILARIDPFLFTFLETSIILPFSLLLLLLYRKEISRDLLKRGVILGGFLAWNLILLASALNYTTATNTAFFPAISGIVVVFYAWAFLKQKISWITWFAGFLSVLGTLLLVFKRSHTQQWFGDFLALLAPLFYAAYIFRLDHDTKERSFISLWSLLGIELVAMWFFCGVSAFFLGSEFSIKGLQTRDYGIIIYIGLITTFLPAAISIFFQRYLSPVSVAFIFILEPIWGVVFAMLYLGEKLSLQGYLGGSLIVIASLLNTALSLKSNQSKEQSG